jgi:iron complex outermembrane recepter protein
MKYAILTFVIFIIFSDFQLSARQAYTLTGKVLDQNNTPLTGAAVVLNDHEFTAITDITGEFSIRNLPESEYRISVSHVGYKTFVKQIHLGGSDSFIEIQLKPLRIELEEASVKENYADTRKLYESRSTLFADEHFIRENLSGSLMSSIARLPGVGSMEIGSGQSKPVIRGLGFNRLLIMENGIKHEAQQWGTDHGLEIDQFAIERIEVVKGPASLAYGTDAIAGVVEFRHHGLPVNDTLGVEIDLLAKTNNNLIGSSAMVFMRKSKFSLSARFTGMDYADYKVPTDSVDIYSYRVPLYKNRLRNSAGHEYNFHFSLAYAGNKFNSRLFISEMSSKSGFFANAHGLEPRRVDEAMYDRSDRDIMMPYQQVNHFKIINRNGFTLGGLRAELDLAFQNNYREEWSRYVPHGYMPPSYPDSLAIPADLEKELGKNIYSGNMRFIMTPNEVHSITWGINTEFIDNGIGGIGFIIPAFTQLNAGLFLIDRMRISDKLVLNAGLRFDAGNLAVKEYHDWFSSEFEEEGSFYSGHLKRASDFNKTYQNLSWSFGGVYQNGNYRFRINAGKGFRVPGAQELASNGINYRSFRYEIGDTSLMPEVSYQLDLGMDAEMGKWSLYINPFINYFSNYIYLNPSYKYNYSYGAGNQEFNYTQGRVIRTGGEANIDLSD